MSAGRTWPPRSSGPGGGAGFAPPEAAWNPAKFLQPEVAVDSTGQVVSGAGSRTLTGTELVYLGAAALAVYIFGARHMGGRMIPFRHMERK